MKKLLLILSVALLAGCESGVIEGLDLPKNKIPEELRECKFYSIDDDRGNRIRVVRCPNSSTGAAWKSGKSMRYSATVEANQPSTDPDVARVEAALKKIDEEIARLEALKKELK